MTAAPSYLETEEKGSIGKRPVSRKPSPGRLAPLAALWRLVCFFGLVIALVFVMNALVGSGLRRIKTSSYGAWNRAMQGKVNADVIISGSSRAAYDYDPRVIEAVTGVSAFNLGRNGSQTDVQLAVLRAYLEHNRKPRLIVHSLDAFTFVTTREVYDPALYIPYLKDEQIYRPLRQINPNFFKSRYIPLYGYVVEDMNFSWVLGLGALLGWSPKENYFLGFSPQNRKWTGEFQKYQAANPEGVSFAVEPAGVQVLDQLIQLCQQNSIQLVFVYPPEYSEMEAMTNNREQIFAKFKELAARANVPIWDYSDWKYDGNRDLFYNSQHLNAGGAAIFSRDFADRLKSYFAEQAAPVRSSEASGQERSSAPNE
jgi:hypothetical protein